MVKKVAKKKAGGKKRSTKVTVDVEQAKPWHECIEIEPSSKAELQWLHTQLTRCGVRSIGDLENLIARAE
jgi:hypothetical protein